MKKIFKYLMACILLFTISISCQQDPLDKDPISSITETAVFQDLNLTKAFLANCYNYLFSVVYSGYPISLDTDHLTSNRATGNQIWAAGTMTASNMGNFTSSYAHVTWARNYSAINDVNSLLANIDDVPTKDGSEVQLKERIKSEAYFIRAYCYTSLLQAYGGVVITDKVINIEEDYLAYIRSSLKDTRDFILSDIEKAINGLPKKGNIDQGRATKGAAAALKVRLLTFCASDLVNGGYMSGNPLVSFQDGTQKSRWEAVREAALPFMRGDYGSYNLTGTTEDPPENMTEKQIWEYAHNYSNIFLQKGNWNDELIWGIQLHPEVGYGANFNLRQGPNGWHNYGTCDPSEQFVREYEMVDGSKFIWDKYDPGNELVREGTAAELASNPYLNPYYRREPRFYGSILYHGAPWQKRPADVIAPDTVQSGYFVKAGASYTDNDAITPGMDTRQSSIENWNSTMTGYYIRKLLDPKIEGQFFNNVQTWTEFRYAEILLSYAEACIELGGGELQNGLDALNKVRNRAGLPDRSTSDKAEAREFLRHERNLEFFMEHQRWFDIRRWMIAPEVIQTIHATKVYEWEDGQMRWEWDKKTIAHARGWKNDRQYWLPIRITEIQKAPQLEQNPDY